MSLLDSCRVLIAVPRKVRRNVRQQGVANTLRLAWHKMTLAWNGSPEGRKIEEDYDARHSIDTAGNIDLGLLKIDSPNLEYGNKYQAINPFYFARFMESVPLAVEESVFIDIGSGKGRALFLASDYPFREIIGVEFAPALHETALRNIASYRSESRKCMSIRSVCMDAAQFEFPLHPLLLFMNNPFEENVMKGVLTNIRRTVEQMQRPIYIVYVNPTLKPLLVREGFKVVVEAMVEKSTYLVLSPETPSASQAARPHRSLDQPPS